MSEKGAKPQIWISPRDTDGRPVDPELIAIGYKVFPGVVKFAQQIGLPDMTCIPEIVERVVHATSRNNGSGAFIEKSPQYIYAACKYEICHLAEREALSEQTSHEDFDAGIDIRSLDLELKIHQRLRVEEALAEIKDRHRDLLILFSENYPWEYIGPLVGLTPESAKTLCHRLLRRLRKAERLKAKPSGNTSNQSE
jgi:hypothetical protein